MPNQMLSRPTADFWVWNTQGFIPKRRSPYGSRTRLFRFKIWSSLLDKVCDTDTEAIYPAYASLGASKLARNWPDSNPTPRRSLGPSRFVEAWRRFLL